MCTSTYYRYGRYRRSLLYSAVLYTSEQPVFYKAYKIESYEVVNKPLYMIVHDNNKEYSYYF